MSTINLGILGFGGMGNWHANKAGKIDGINVISVHDIDQERLHDAQVKGLKAYENRAAFLEDPGINFVLIATPNHLHKEYALEALSAGKNIIVEKPVTMRVSEFDEINEASKKANTIFTVHHNRRWDTDFLIIKDVIKSGVIGNVFSIDSRVYGNNGKIYGWRTMPQYGGGMVYDWGVHLFDQMLCLYQDRQLISVYAQKLSLMNQDVDDLFKVEMCFEGDPSVHVEVGTFALRRPPRFLVIGDKGTLTIEDYAAKEGGIRVLNHRVDDMGKVIVDTPTGPTRTMAPQPDDCFQDYSLPEIKGDWAGFYENLLETVRGKSTLAVTPESVRRTMQVVEAVIKSANTNSVIKL